MNKDFFGWNVFYNQSCSIIYSQTIWWLLLPCLKILQTKPSLNPTPMRLEWSHALISALGGMQGDDGRCQGPISYFPSFHNDDHIHF